MPDENAVRALAEQKNIRVIRIVDESPKEVKLVVKRSASVEKTHTHRKWDGALAAISTTSGEEWDKCLHEIRNEWERDI